MPGKSTLSPEQLEYSRFMAGLFSRISPRYDRLNRIISLGQDRRWRRLAAGLLRSDIEGPVLDLATGTGELALEVWGSGRQVVGCDLTREMLEKARDKFRRRGAVEIPLVQAHAFSLPFPDAAFSGVTLGFALRDLPPLEQLFREVLRVLRPGGKMVCVELARPSSKFLSPLHRAYLFGLVPLIGSWLGKDGRAYSYLARSLLPFPSPDELSRLIRRAGFKEAGHRTFSFGIIAIHWGCK